MMSERTYKIWSDCWRAPEEWLRSVEKAVQGNGCVVLRSGIYDRWDLEVRAGAPSSFVSDRSLGGAILRMGTLTVGVVVLFAVGTWGSTLASQVRELREDVAALESRTDPHSDGSGPREYGAIPGKTAA